MGSRPIACLFHRPGRSHGSLIRLDSPFRSSIENLAREPEWCRRDYAAVPQATGASRGVTDPPWKHADSCLEVLPLWSVFLARRNKETRVGWQSCEPQKAEAGKSCIGLPLELRSSQKPKTIFRSFPTA